MSDCKPDSNGWMPIATCPRVRGVDYQLWSNETYLIGCYQDKEWFTSEIDFYEITHWQPQPGKPDDAP